jgi:predicted DNA-binding antitoxin AbrB/MazE fold protein
MTITVEATYENGLLRPLKPLTLAENERVEITIQTLSNSNLDKKPVRQSEKNDQPKSSTGYGLLRWTGDPETLRQIAEDPEHGLWGSS